MTNALPPFFEMLQIKEAVQIARLLLFILYSGKNSFLMW